MRSSKFLCLALCAALLAACGGKNDPQSPAAAGDSPEQLPTPAGTSGGVTGMPDHPGPGHVGPPSELPPEVVLDENGNPIPADGSATAGLNPDGTPIVGDATGEPSPEDAVSVIREYYAALNRGDFARAHALWADGGQASGQTPQQFAAGFADTVGVSVEVMPPGPVDPAAGSRYIEVPVTITATQRDGSQHRFAGTYVLRRAVVEGATPEQRAWRIGSADIDAVQP